jgi:uncharacterized protein (DUF4415 family)
MQKPRPLTNKDGEVRELTLEDMKRFRPIAEIDPGMPETIENMRNKGGRPKVEAPKVLIGFRLAADVVKRVKASGKGYNARVEKVLSEALDAGKI